VWLIVNAVIIFQVYQYYNKTSGQVATYCDNKGALAHVFKKKNAGIIPFLFSGYEITYTAHNLFSLISVTLAGCGCKAIMNIP
jgi:hypothetical protein